MSLECQRNPEYLERTNVNTGAADKIQKGLRLIWCGGAFPESQQVKEQLLDSLTRLEQNLD